MASVAEVLVDALARAGTPRLFGVPGGGSSLEVLDAARRRGLPFVLAHGETAACLMAAVSGDLTGAPGAALATLGPGAASAANGVAYAFLDRAPLLFLTDRHPASALAYTTHQRFDHSALLGPVTKASFTLEPESAGETIGRAIRVAMAHPRGPVHLDLAPDVAGRPALAACDAWRPSALAAPDAAALDAAARRLGEADRPVIVAGLHTATDEVAKWLRALAEALPAPVLVTYRAKGAFPDAHPLMHGLFTGGVLEETIVGRADLVVALGLDTVELIPRPWASRAPVLHVGPVPHDGGYFEPVLQVVGDIALVIEELAPRLRGRPRADWNLAELDRLKRAMLGRLAIATPGLAPHRVVEIAREAAPPCTIVTVDAGAHMFPATSFWPASAPGEFLISNGLSTMGFALPAAIAAQLARPARRVVCLTGDGGLMMASAELETAARLGLPIVVVVFDDAALSLIQVKQQQRGVEGVSMSYAGPDLVALAESFGLAAFGAASEDELRAAMRSALAADRPALVAARIDASGYRQMLEVVRGAADGGLPPTL